MVGWSLIPINYAKREPCTGVLFTIFVAMTELLLIMKNVAWSSKYPLNHFESVKYLVALLSPYLAHLLWHSLCTVALTNGRARQRVFPLYYLSFSNVRTLCPSVSPVLAAAAASECLGVSFDCNDAFVLEPGVFGRVACPRMVHRVPPATLSPKCQCSCLVLGALASHLRGTMQAWRATSTRAFPSSEFIFLPWNLLHFIAKSLK